MARRPDPHSADRVRQGEIILKRPWMRVVFIVGLVLMVLAALFFSLSPWGR
jgi:hypothetical protein